MRKLRASPAVLPDSAAGEALTETLHGAVVLSYASGRPCLLAASPGEIVTAEVGHARLAVIGTCPVTASRLRRTAARLGCLADTDAVAAALPGSFHLVAVVGGQVRVQGTASGMRRVYYARTGGAVVASDRAALLAALTGAAVDEQALAMRLLMMVPPALAEPLWERGRHGAARRGGPHRRGRGAAALLVAGAGAGGAAGGGGSRGEGGP